MVRFNFLPSIWLILICVLVTSALYDNTYPTCGSCWCVPDNGGLGDCPSPAPNMEFSDAIIKAYQNQQPKAIYSLNCNPYKDRSCITTPAQVMLNMSSAVCAFRYPNAEDGSDSCTNYTMVTYASHEKAENDGAVVTHAGSCGLCSTAQDLSVYLIEDFTAAGKKCATIGLFNEDKGLQCYMDIGLTRECAKIWNYDGIYDGKVCGKTCAQHLNDPNNGPPPACELNVCLQCDEKKAGPNFSSFSGRTRRRSGLLSEIVRTCSSIANITHNPCSNPACGC
ncbi:hypothetical protein EON65_31420 [archaeon]|nr:MAG: hypothetical protein EON65_31420 [archaeon]